MKTKERLEFERQEKFKRLLEIKFGKEEMDISPNPCWDGYEPIGLKEDGSPNCVPIKAAKEEFVIPSPEGGEAEDVFISRCISAVADEYTEDGQAYAVCKSKWDEK